MKLQKGELTIHIYSTHIFYYDGMYMWTEKISLRRLFSLFFMK